jgi:nucleotide-binding universal stress UspA family protein
VLKRTTFHAPLRSFRSYLQVFPRSLPPGSRVFSLFGIFFRLPSAGRFPWHCICRKDERLEWFPIWRKERVMLPIPCILHPTDFSERSEYAFRLACSLARDHGGEVLVLHVLEPQAVVYGDMVIPRPDEVVVNEVKKKLLQIQGPDGKICRHRLEEGLPVEQILRVAKESKCNMIVMGTHGRRGFSRVLLGSVAEQVMRKAPCPVVVVKAPFPQTVASPGAPVQEVVKT